MFLKLFITAFVCFYWASADEECGLEQFSNCIDPIYNSTTGHERGLFQNAADLYQSCRIIKEGTVCVRNFGQKCGTEMIAEDFNDQFEKPLLLLEAICNSQSPIQAQYLQVTECMNENVAEFSACTEKVQEFLFNFEADTDEKEKTMTCMYEMMFRSCLLSTATNTCGLNAADLVRKALQYSPSTGLKLCFDTVPL